MLLGNSREIRNDATTAVGQQFDSTVTEAQCQGNNWANLFLGEINTGN
jgi:hypothetical protein